MAVEYEVQWRRGNQGWNVNNRQAETTATMYTITNLTPATYQVRVSGRAGWRTGPVVNPPERGRNKRRHSGSDGTGR